MLWDVPKRSLFCPQWVGQVLPWAIPKWSQVVPKSSQSRPQVVPQLFQNCFQVVSKLSRKCLKLVPKILPSCPKGAGYFHSASQRKEGKLVLTLPSIRFSWNFYQIISGTKYEYRKLVLDPYLVIYGKIMAKFGSFGTWIWPQSLKKSYGFKRSFLLIFSARDDLIKV